MEPPDDDLSSVEFECPRCGTSLEQFSEVCPECGCPLNEEFCATYRPATPKAIKTVALILLLGLILIPLGALLWRWVF